LFKFNNFSLMRFFCFAVGGALASVAAFYSITGLAYIFGASVFWQIVVMGSSLEAAKLVGASFVFRNWRQAPKILIGYMSVGVLLLMVITDIGIFGYLSRAYLEQQEPIALLQSSNAAVERDADLARQQYERDDAALAAFVEGDTATAVIEELTAYARLTGTNGAVEVLRSQQAIQRELQANLQVSSAALSAAERAFAEVEQETQIQRVDVGPLLFVAKAYYGNEDLSTMDTVATAFIILILVVFDPMAIALLLAAQTTIGKVQAKTTGDGWGGAGEGDGGGESDSDGEDRAIPYMPDVAETLPTEEVEPPLVSSDPENPVVGITSEDIGSDVRIGVPAQHAYKSGTAHTRDADEPILPTDTDTDTLTNRAQRSPYRAQSGVVRSPAGDAAEPILPTDTDTDTLANSNLDDTVFVIDRPKSGKRPTRRVTKS
jgi:hypothetical protein